MRSVCLQFFGLAFILGAASGFAPYPGRSSVSESVRRHTPRSDTELSAVISTGKVTAGLVLAAGFFLLSDAALAAPSSSLATDPWPQTLVAARSGGRAGGRAMRATPSPATYRRSSSSTTIIRPMIATPPIVVSPFGGYGYGYGYGNPMGGFGLGYGLGALNSAGESLRDYRQESEIQRERVELEQAKVKEAELEARIKQLEAAQQGAVTAVPAP